MLLSASATVLLLSCLSVRPAFPTTTTITTNGNSNVHDRDSLVAADPANLCSRANLCCRRRDSGCVVQRVFSNHSVDTSELPCYCDQACARLDDCCQDYRQFCSGGEAKGLIDRSLLSQRMRSKISSATYK